MSALEGRYRRLLRAYPEGYRRERGDELLDTLMQLTRPGQRYPRVREAVALVLGGLRRRTGAGAPRTTAAVWAEALHLAVLLLLARAAAMWLSLAAFDVLAPGPREGGLHPWLVPPLAMAALVVAATGRRRAALPLIVAALLAQASQPGWGLSSAFLLNTLVSPLGLATVLAVLLLAVPALRRNRPPAAARPWRWLLAVPALLLLLPGQALALLPPDAATVVGWCAGVATMALLAGALAWAAVDARPPMAISLLMLPLPLATAVLALDVGWSSFVPLYALLWVPVFALPLLVGAARAPRQARL